MRRSSPGFSLIELMAVVGIISGIMMLGIPRYRAYQVRARQAEVKAALSNAATSLKTFFVETRSFTSCLQEIGVLPTGDFRYYAVGISQAGATANGNLCGPQGNTACTFYGWQDTPAAPGNPTTDCSGNLSIDAGPNSSNLPINATRAEDPQANLNLVNQLSTVDTPAASMEMERDRFLLGGEGSIADLQGGTRTDAWNINHQKRLQNPRDGAVE